VRRQAPAVSPAQPAAEARKRPPTIPSGMVRRLVVVRCLVQGVGFRAEAARAARARGVAGWIRNRSDGAVEAVLEGELAAVDSMLRWLSEGPPGAVVSALEVREEEPLGAPGFVIRAC